jgi:hypothetical protein
MMATRQCEPTKRRHANSAEADALFVCNWVDAIGLHSGERNFAVHVQEEDPIRGELCIVQRLRVHTAMGFTTP